MKALVRSMRFLMIGIGLLAGAAWATADHGGATGEVTLKATSYADLVRFEAHGSVKELRVEIFSLAGEKLFDSGSVPSAVLDWRLANWQGERVASGVYLYRVTVQDPSGNLTQRIGKLALLRGQAGLGLAPPLLALPTVGDLASSKLISMSHTDSGSVFYCCLDPAEKMGVGTSSIEAAYKMAIVGEGLSVRRLGGDGPFVAYESLSDDVFAPVKVDFYRSNAANTTTPSSTNIAQYRFTGQTTTGAFYIGGSIVASGGPNSATGFPLDWVFRTNPGDGSGEQDRMAILANGNVGIGINSATAKTHINNTANQTALRVDASNGTNAIEVRNTGTGSATGLIFRVERATGNVYADGSFNGAAFNTGTGADVAERIDITEAVEAGDVVEIDPDTPGKFRKAREALSTRVAGIITAAPAIVLNNRFNAEEDRWEDNRPMVALAGRVPVKAIAKYGEIKVGDLLTSSPIPGYAMVCPEAARCIGAIVGKALEPLNEGVGKIEVQVMLR